VSLPIYHGDEFRQEQDYGNPAGGGPSANYADGDTPEFVAGLVLKAIEEGEASISRMNVFENWPGFA